MRLLQLLHRLLPGLGRMLLPDLRHTRLAYLDSERQRSVTAVLTLDRLPAWHRPAPGLGKQRLLSRATAMRLETTASPAAAAAAA